MHIHPNPQYDVHPARPPCVPIPRLLPHNYGWLAKHLPLLALLWAPFVSWLVIWGSRWRWRGLGLLLLRLASHDDNCLGKRIGWEGRVTAGKIDIVILMLQYQLSWTGLTWTKQGRRRWKNRSESDVLEKVVSPKRGYMPENDLSDILDEKQWAMMSEAESPRMVDLMRQHGQPDLPDLEKHNEGVTKQTSTLPWSSHVPHSTWRFESLTHQASASTWPHHGALSCFVASAGTSCCEAEAAACAVVVPLSICVLCHPFLATWDAPKLLCATVGLPPETHDKPNFRWNLRSLIAISKQARRDSCSKARGVCERPAACLPHYITLTPPLQEPAI